MDGAVTMAANGSPAAQESFLGLHIPDAFSKTKTQGGCSEPLAAHPCFLLCLSSFMQQTE